MALGVASARRGWTETPRLAHPVAAVQREEGRDDARHEKTERVEAVAPGRPAVSGPSIA